MLLLFAVAGEASGDGYGTSIESVERFAWYTAGIATTREVGLGEVRLYWILFRFRRTRCLPWGYR